MKFVRSESLFILPTLYMVAVIICIVLAFDYSGQIHSEWTMVLIGLTLPWSIISVLFIWSLIHGAGLEFFTVLYLVCAAINAVILYFIGLAIRTRRPRPAKSPDRSS